MVFGFAFIFLKLPVPVRRWGHLNPLFGTDLIDFILEVAQGGHGVCLSSEAVCKIYNCQNESRFDGSSHLQPVFVDACVKALSESMAKQRDELSDTN